MFYSSFVSVGYSLIPPLTSFFPFINTSPKGTSLFLFVSFPEVIHFPNCHHRSHILSSPLPLASTVIYGILINTKLLSEMFVFMVKFSLSIGVFVRFRPSTPLSTFPQSFSNLPKSKTLDIVLLECDIYFLFKNNLKFL